MGNYIIIWSFQAQQDLKDIYEYWKKKSVQGDKKCKVRYFEKP